MSDVNYFGNITDLRIYIIDELAGIAAWRFNSKIMPLFANIIDLKIESRIDAGFAKSIRTEITNFLQ